MSGRALWPVALVLTASVAASVSAAQESRTAPLSAIDWLSRSVDAAPAPAAPGETAPGRADEAPVAGSASSPEITVTPLDSGRAGPGGVLSPDETGLPRSLWSASPEALLTDLVRAERGDALPAMQTLLATLMLAEADPPLGAGPDDALFLARVDRLLELGALHSAADLLASAGPGGDAARFMRQFDVALLLGTEDAACVEMQARPALAPTLQARVFCLARLGDWNAAALTLNTAIALGDVSGEEESILVRFLDDSLDDAALPLPLPDRISPLVFRLYEAIGEALPTANLPRAFAQADLRTTTAWRLRMEAAERLARVGAIPPEQLFDLYALQRPAASGGVWDRAAAVQALDAALGQAPGDVAEALPAAWQAAQTARTEVAFAEVYAPALAALPLDGAAEALAHRIALLSPDYEAAALSRPPADAEERVLHGVARGDMSGVPLTDAHSRAIAEAFMGATPPEPLAIAIAEGRTGEVLLRAISLFNAGSTGDPVSITDALATFRAVGMEDVARQAALQYLILDRPG